MPNRLLFPYLSPVWFTDVNLPVIPQYTSKNFLDNRWHETIIRQEQPVIFRQPWLTVDAIRIQLVSNYQPITLKVYLCDGGLVLTQTFATFQEDADNPGFFIRQIDVDMTIFEAGRNYYFEVWGGTPTGGGSGLPALPPVRWRSEPFTIQLEYAKPTLLLEYSHFEKRGGIWFQAPFEPSLRVYGRLFYDETESVDTIYVDQDQNEELLHSVNYRVWNLVIGDAPGIPPWQKDIISRIFGCSDVRIDGRFFVKADGAKWERSQQKDYPMKGWTIKLRERYNRDSAIVDNDVVIRGIAAAGLIVDTKGFGMTNLLTDYHEIESVL